VPILRELITAPAPGLDLRRHYGHFQSPAIRAGGLMHGTLTSEAHVIFGNLKLLLESAGSSLDRLVQVHALIYDSIEYDVLNRVYRQYLIEGYFHTGARPGDNELTACDVQHFDARRHQVYLPRGKTGARYTTLTREACAFFSRITRTAGKPMSRCSCAATARAGAATRSTVSAIRTVVREQRGRLCALRAITHHARD
jgi:2-iminobutanoate/2-iminopropanoate deaminase